MLRHLHAILGVLDGARNQLAGIPGRVGRALGQIAHFFGNHRETLARVAGARRLDRRIKRQQIGLECDLFNRLDDAGTIIR